MRRAVAYSLLIHGIPSMFARLTACSLIVLVLAPFTAPFPTCDVATLFGHVSGAALPSGTGCGGSWPHAGVSFCWLRLSRRHAGDAVVGPDEPDGPAPSAEVSNDPVVLGASAFLGAGRIRQLPLPRASSLSSERASPSTPFQRTYASTRHSLGDDALRTVLRV